MRSLVRACWCAAIMMCGAGCESVPTATPVAVAPIADTVLPTLEARIFALVAAARLADQPGSPPFVSDPQLTAVARQRSQKMAASGAYADAGGDPHVSASLLMAREPQFQGMVGENVAALTLPPERPVDVEVLAVRFARSWLTSRPHRENLMISGYDRSGVGAALAGDTVYVTQLFAARLPLPAAASAPGSQVPQVANPPHGTDDDAGATSRGTTPP